MSGGMCAAPAAVSNERNSVLYDVTLGELIFRGTNTGTVHARCLGLLLPRPLSGQVAAIRSGLNGDLARCGP